MATKKKTALAAKIERDSGAAVSTERLARLGLLVFGALAFAIGAWQISGKLMRSYTEARVERMTIALNQAVIEKIATLKGPVLALAADPKVAATLANPVKNPSGALTDSLKTQLPSLQSLHLIGPDIQALMASERPGFSYAALDQLYVA
jgi:hypothetical protein